MKKLSLLSRITFALFLLLSVATLTGCAGLKTSPDVTKKEVPLVHTADETQVKQKIIKPSKPLLTKAMLIRIRDHAFAIANAWTPTVVRWLFHF